MSGTSQIEFARLVENYYQQHHSALRLSAPSVENDGFITIARMVGPSGSVEIRCGPAEYNAEIFIQTREDQRRWNLTDLMSMESVRDWMRENRPNSKEKPRLEAEIECAFCLIVDGLRGVEDFQWIYSR